MITKIKINPEILSKTPGLEEMFKSKETDVIDSIVMSSVGFPEQYDCLDKYGNLLAWLRVADAKFIVECPDCTMSCFTIVYERDIANDGLSGIGNFVDSERVEQISIAIDHVNEWYEGGKLIYREPNPLRKSVCDPKYVYMPRGNHTDRDIYMRLYEYEQSNLVPEEVMDLRRKGYAVGYRECILKIIHLHRMTRRANIPESIASGLTEEHVEQELKWFKYSNINWPDSLIARLMAVNWIFDKTFDDFKEIFIECSKFSDRDIPNE